jgi:hypothetical protein
MPVSKKAMVPARERGRTGKLTLSSPAGAELNRPLAGDALG